jgi:conjugal transfer pilus assembly protein TraB
MSLKERFNSLTPERKKLVIWSMVGILILLVTITGYNLRSDKSSVRFLSGKKNREIQLQPDLIQKTMLREQRRQLDELRESVEAIKREQKRPQALATAKKEHPKDTLPKIPDADQVVKQTKVKVPPPVQDQQAPGRRGAGKLPAQPPREPVMIGDISVLTNPAAELGPPPDKKKGRTVYLPPSFMEAKLLTGFDASTSGKGTNNPEPLLLRIQTPAVLPNDIKANLKGCFVIAEAVGRLDKERADVRLVSLSCLSNEGRAIIDTPIKGFVTDSDSKVGLAGRVVSRMGAATARTIVAGFFGGMGDMLKATATTQSTSALGTTTTVDSSQIAKYSLGGGLSEGSESLHDFYLSLAKQATPVIEVGATKKITVIISEGKELEIRELGEETI